jgi:3-isopropylmalate/(R)-2-methylmalate dehydratase small subunit
MTVARLMHGHAYKLGDDLTVAHIIPERHFHRRRPPATLVPVLFEDLDPTLAGRLSQGAVLVAGRNFGLGPADLSIPTVLRLAGVCAVLALSFGRLFYRNALTVGLPALVCETTAIQDGDELMLDLPAGQVINVSTGQRLPCGRLRPAVLRWLEEGGLIPYLRRHRAFIA